MTFGYSDYSNSYYQCPGVEKQELRSGLEEMYEVASANEDIRKARQDGGAVTSLLAYALESYLLGFWTIKTLNTSIPVYNYEYNN